MKRLTREKSRKCDGCSYVGEVVLFAVGSKDWRLCVPCHSAMERLWVQLVVECLDSVESYA